MLRWLRRLRDRILVRLWKRAYGYEPAAPALAPPKPNPAATYTITGILEASLIENGRAREFENLVGKIDPMQVAADKLVADMNKQMAQLFGNLGITMSQANRNLAAAQQRVRRAQQRVRRQYTLPVWHGSHPNYWSSTVIKVKKDK